VGVVEAESTKLHTGTVVVGVTDELPTFAHSSQFALAPPDVQAALVGRVAAGACTMLGADAGCTAAGSVAWVVA
jgi:hypothetical protein